MWFKQIKVFEIASPIEQIASLEEKLEQLIFEPCSTHTPFAVGWVDPIDVEDGMLVHDYKSYKMLCLQTEEKVVPLYVVQQELVAIIKQLELTEQRTISNKEKLILKHKVYSNLLPKAFSRINKIYAYFDFANKWLILNTMNPKKVEVFLAIIKKTVADLELIPLSVKNLTTTMTNWLQQENYPKTLSIEDHCIFKNPRKAKSIIKSQGHDLFSKEIQLFLRDGYQVDQIAITWQDQVTFILKENCNLANIKYGEQVTSATKIYPLDHATDRFVADFIIMT